MRPRPVDQISDVQDLSPPANWISQALEQEVDVSGRRENSSSGQHLEVKLQFEGQYFVTYIHGSGIFRAEAV